MSRKKSTKKEFSITNLELITSDESAFRYNETRDNIDSLEDFPNGQVEIDPEVEEVYPPPEVDDEDDFPVPDNEPAFATEGDRDLQQILSSIRRLF